MTITATQFPARPLRSSADADPALPGAEVSWRALSASLWAARRDGRHLGTVQHGRRWLASDADSEPIGSFRTFAEAQAAVRNPAARRTEVRGPALSGPVLAGAGLLVAVTSATIWASAILLL